MLALALLAGCSVPRWPVEAPVSSPFGLRMTGWWPDVHHGVDLAAPVGEPVRAMRPGRVRYAGRLRGYGLTIIIDHGGGWETRYAHLSALAVETGQRVESRQIIGRVGQTGNARGAHLHFEVRRKGRAQDPVPLLGGPPADG